MPKRTVKPCGPVPPDAGDNLRVTSPGGWRLASPVLQGERGISRKTIVQGMPDCFGVPVVTTRVLSTFVREAAGATNTRHSLRPPVLRGW
jgi:hypothetical protein